MKIEKIRVEDLSLDPANARKHPERNLEAIKASLRRFGQQKPIVIDASNVVRAGNGTLEAAKALGWETVDCVRTKLTGSEATAYAIADNRTAELAEWNHEYLQAILGAFDQQTVEDAGFNVQDVQVLSQKEFIRNAEGFEVPADVPVLTGEEQGDEEESEEEETMFFSVVLPRSDHELLIRATNLAKKSTGEQRMSYALLHICKKFLGEGEE